MYDEKAKNRIMKYQAKNRETLNLNLPVGTKEKWKTYAEERGTSVTALITELIENEIERYKKIKTF